MFLPKIKRYQKEFEYSYAFGAYPVIDLLRSHPEEILKILFKEGGIDSEGISTVESESKKKGIHCEINDRLIDKISIKENTYVVAVFKKYVSAIKSGNNHLVLVNPTNTGNLGTILRTMLGFGFKDLAIIEPAVDIFDPLVIRASMGAIFNLNFEHFKSLEEYLEKFKENNYYPFMLNGSKSVEEVEFLKPYSIIHGNESKGLDKKYLTVGESVYIPHNREIDSLNLSIATAISLWEASKSNE